MIIYVYVDVYRNKSTRYMISIWCHQRKLSLTKKRLFHESLNTETLTHPNQTPGSCWFKGPVLLPHGLFVPQQWRCHHLEALHLAWAKRVSEPASVRCSHRLPKGTTFKRDIKHQPINQQHPSTPPAVFKKISWFVSILTPKLIFEGVGVVNLSVETYRKKIIVQSLQLPLEECGSWIFQLKHIFKIIVQSLHFPLEEEKKTTHNCTVSHTSWFIIPSKKGCSRISEFLKVAKLQSFQWIQQATFESKSWICQKQCQTEIWFGGGS